MGREEKVFILTPSIREQPWKGPLWIALKVVQETLLYTTVFFFFGEGGFFYFLNLGKSGKSSTGNPTIYYWLWIYQGSKYGSSSKHARVLNILFPKYKKVLFPEIRRIYFWRFSFLKYKKSFLLRKYKRFFNIRARKIHFSGI